VEAKVSTKAYQLMMPPMWKGHPVFHEEKLKKYHKPKFPDQEKPSDKVRDITLDNWQEYEVESILGQQTQNGQHWYLVHWTGYGHEDDTWELVSALTKSQRKVQEFESQDEIPRRDTMLYQIKTNVATCSDHMMDSWSHPKKNPDRCPYMTNNLEELLTLTQHEVSLLSKLGKTPRFKKAAPGLVQIAKWVI
jgi:hypothetical protein